MNNTKFKKIKRFTNLASMFLVILLGFSLLVADSDMDHINFSLSDYSPGNVSEDFYLSGNISYYNADTGKDRKIKESEVNIGIQLHLLSGENNMSTKEIYTNYDYPIDIDGETFELFFSVAELKLEEEFNKVKDANDLENKTTESITLQMDIIVSEDDPQDGGQYFSFNFQYTPETE